jgi:environmental stress-induced protein Ves
MLTVIRQSSFIAAPWKNGGGVTHEVIRVPQNGDSFRWRVSVANIDASGPFSDFAGYNRRMVLLRGRGLSLKFGNAERRSLQSIGDLAEFDGGMATYCELLNGPCVDLNLMVLKSVTANAAVEHLSGVKSLHATQGESALIFSIAAELSVTSDAGQSTRLDPWDLAVLTDDRARVERFPSDDISTPNAVFFATITD